MKPDKDVNWVIPVSLFAAGFGAFSYFTSPTAFDRGEGLKLPQVNHEYCKPQFKGDTYCKR